MAEDETSVGGPTSIPLPASPTAQERDSVAGSITQESTESLLWIGAPSDQETEDGNEGLAGWIGDWPWESAVVVPAGSLSAAQAIDVERPGPETTRIAPAQATTIPSEEAAVAPATSAMPVVAPTASATPAVPIHAAPKAEEREYPEPKDRYPPPNPEFFTEFEKRYTPDVFGEEASPNARVWRVYRDRVTDLDDDLLDGWHKTLDVLLIFIGLVSAVATAFIIESSKRLQPDFGEITAKGVIALLSQADPSIITPAIPSFDTVELTARAMWINALWFASLTLALVDALLAILGKQWLVEYASKQRQPAASAQHWAWRHYAFRRGLDRWGIGVFISALPVILFTALYLFLFGLLVFLFKLNAGICVSSMALTIIVAVFHVATTLAPLWWGDCPTTTPLLSHLSWLFSVVHLMLSCISYLIKKSLRISARAWVQLRRRLTRLWKNRSSTNNTMNDDREDYSDSYRAEIPSWPTLATIRVNQSKPAYDGAAIILGRAPLRDSKVLAWMVENLLTDADVGVAIEAIGACNHEQHMNYDWQEGNPLRSRAVGHAAEGRLFSLARLNEQRDRALHHRRQASTIRTLLFIQWKAKSRERLSLVRVFPEEAYDIDVLSGMWFDRNFFGNAFKQHMHLDSFKRIGNRCANEESLGTRHAHHQTKLILWMDAEAAWNIEPDSSYYYQVDLHVVYGIMESASQEPVSTTHLRIALTISNNWLDQQVAQRCDQMVCDKWTVLAESYKDNCALAALIKWGFALTDVETADQLQLDTELHLRIFERILLHASQSAKVTPWPVSLVETGLCIFFQPHGGNNLRRKWPTPVLAAALEIFGKLDLQRDWSQKMTRLLHALLRTSSELEVVDQSLVTAVWDILYLSGTSDYHQDAMSIIGQYSQPEDAISETAVGALLFQPVGGHSPSPWELAVKISRDLSREHTLVADRLASILAIISQIWPGRCNLEPLVDTLAGGERGIRLALAQTHIFVTVAGHARMASPNWWTKFRPSLLALSKEQWGQRQYQFWHATPKALVDDIDERDSCLECLEGIQKFEEGPKPDQDTSQVSDPHNSPAAVPAAITFDDIHPTEISAPSTATFGLSHVVSAFRMAARLRAHMQRAQQDEEMQLTPLVASTSLQPASSTGDARIRDE